MPNGLLDVELLEELVALCVSIALLRPGCHLRSVIDWFAKLRRFPPKCYSWSMASFLCAFRTTCSSGTDSNSAPKDSNKYLLLNGRAKKCAGCVSFCVRRIWFKDRCLCTNLSLSRRQSLAWAKLRHKGVALFTQWKYNELDASRYCFHYYCWRWNATVVGCNRERHSLKLNCENVSSEKLDALPVRSLFPFDLHSRGDDIDFDLFQEIQPDYLSPLVCCIIRANVARRAWHLALSFISIQIGYLEAHPRNSWPGWFMCHQRTITMHCITCWLAGCLFSGRRIHQVHSQSTFA